jgi:hypothetical protein
VTDGWKVDRLERGIRFGCGALFGSILGFSLAIRGFPERIVWTVLVAFGVALAFGFLATRYGDRFWERIASIMRGWFWW